MPITQEVERLVNTLEQEYHGDGSHLRWEVSPYKYYPSAVKNIVEKKLEGGYQASPQAYYLNLFMALVHSTTAEQLELFPSLNAIFSHRLRKAVAKLSSADLLRGDQAQANFNAVAGHRAPDDVARALKALSATCLLTGVHAQANRDAVADHRAPDAVALVLKALDAAGLITGEQAQANFDAVKHHPSPGTLRLLIRILSYSGLMEDGEAQTTFDLIIEQSGILFGIMVCEAWRLVPPDFRLTPQQFVDMVAICQAPTQTTVARQAWMTTYINRHFVTIERHRSEESASAQYTFVQSASLSAAAKLKNRYRECATEDETDRSLFELAYFINQRFSGVDPRALQIMGRSLARLGRAGIVDTFTDRASGVSTRQLLALIWRAIHDDAQRIGTLEEAQLQLMRSLYEIQRSQDSVTLKASGIIMSRHIEDEDGDRPTCRFGAFTKLVEALDGIHPDVHMRIVTQALAASELPIVVREEVKKFLVTKLPPTTAEEHSAAAGLIGEINDANGCVEPLWEEHIKTAVINRMWDEFGSLFPEGKDGGAFQAFVEAGQWVTLESKVLEKYKHLLNRMMRPATEDAERTEAPLPTLAASPSAFFQSQADNSSPAESTPSSAPEP